MLASFLSLWIGHDQKRIVSPYNNNHHTSVHLLWMAFTHSSLWKQKTKQYTLAGECCYSNGAKKKRKRKRQSNNRRNVSWMNDRDERESWPLAPSRVNGLVFNPIKCQVECQLAADENQSILSGRFVSFYCQPGRDKQNEIGLSTSREKNSRRKTFQRERKERHIFRRKKNSGIHK